MNIRKSLAIVGALTAIAVGVACTGGGTHVKGDSKPAAVATDKATDKADKNDSGLKTFALGQTGTVTRDDADLAKVTLSNARVLKDDEGVPALVVTVTVKVLPDAVGTFDVNEFDFDARAADGTTLDMAFLWDGPAELSSATLSAGQTAKGVIAFKLGKTSQHGVIISYSPLFDTLAYWTVG